MDKFLNRMYDIFAFALPGMSAIGSFLLFRHNDQFLFQFIIRKYSIDNTWFILILTFLGYITGYLMTPYTRKFLLSRFGIWVENKLKFEQINNSDHFRKMLLSTELSDEFVLIREKTPRTSEYIEFWDMHTNFSINMAFAVLIGFLSNIISCISNKCLTNYSWLLFIILPVAFILLIRNSLHYAKWWVNDIDATLKFLKNQK